MYKRNAIHLVYSMGSYIVRERDKDEKERSREAIVMEERDKRKV